MHTSKKADSKPVMAVLVRNRDQINSYRAQMMNEANKEVKNTLYYFSLDQVRLKERKIKGYYWHNRDNRWYRQEFPFPDILYLRGSIDKSYAQTFTALCNVINKKKGGIITHYRFDKWRLYQIMARDPVMKSYLPVTRTARHQYDLKMMLQGFNVVYLKSHLGKKGENILRIETLPGGGYRYSYYQNELLTEKSVSSFQTLLGVVKRFFMGKKFLIQQAIPLLRYKNRLIDMRAELQRNGDGDLVIVGISVRCGKPGSPITTHGKAYKFESFYTEKMGYSKEKMEALQRSIKEFLFAVYEYIDSNYDRYAEIGIDFAVDTNDNIWFIEANAQSTKVSLNTAYGQSALLRNYKTLLEYAKYLSRKSVKH